MYCLAMEVGHMPFMVLKYLSVVIFIEDIFYPGKSFKDRDSKDLIAHSISNAVELL